MRATTPDVIRSPGTCGPRASSGSAAASGCAPPNPTPTAARHPDLVKTNFTASAPNQVWVTDLTFVPTWAAVASV